MSFKRKYVNRETILKNIGSVDYINSIKSADVVMSDQWASKFLENLNFKFGDYQLKRDSINYEYKLSSNLSYIRGHRDFNKLKSVSNIYINLKTNPQWVDVILASEVVNFKFKTEMSGMFNEMVNFSIEKLENYFNVI